MATASKEDEKKTENIQSRVKKREDRSTRRDGMQAKGRLGKTTVRKKGNKGKKGHNYKTKQKLNITKQKNAYSKTKHEKKNQKPQNGNKILE